MDKRKTYVNRSRKKPSALIPALVILITAALTAMVGAFAWQKVSGNDAEYESKKDMLFSQEALSGLSEAKPSGSAGSNPSNSDESKQSSSVSQSDPVEPGEDKPASSPVVVPESTRVDSAYFDDAMFVGDSITDGIRSYELMQNTTVISHTGINPDSIRSKAVFRDTNGNQVTCLEAMAEHSDAKKIYLMLGANSSAWMDHDLFIKYYEEFVRSMLAQHPDAIIYIQSITPINEDKFKVKYSGQDLDNAKIMSFNKDLIQLAERLGVHYLNVSEALQDAKGQLPDEATSDGMHFSTQYYQKWFDYLKTHTVTK